MIKALVLLLCVAVAFGFNNGYYGDDDRFDLLDDDYRGLRLRLGGRGYSGARYIRPNVYPKYVHRAVSRPSIRIHGGKLFVSFIFEIVKYILHKQLCKSKRVHGNQHPYFHLEFVLKTD